MGECALTHTLGIDGTTPHHGHGRAIPEAQTDQFSYSPDHTLGLRLAHPNIYPIYDFLDQVE